MAQKRRIWLCLLGGTALLSWAVGRGNAETPASPAVVVVRPTCHDGDTCTVDIPGWPPIIGQRMPVRLRGLDAPEIRGACDKERELAVRARDRLRALMQGARRIELREVGRDKYFRLLARVTADGADVAHVLITEGLARRYSGGVRRGWCP